jgi:hypothetical protein
MVVDRVCSAFLRNSSRTVRPEDVPYASIEQFSVLARLGKESWAKCLRRIRRDAGRFDAAEAVRTPRAAYPSGESGFFQHLQPPQFWKPHQLSEFSSIGQSTQMLGASLGSGGQNAGLNPLYQIGGPRSVQLALKLLF